MSLTLGKSFDRSYNMRIPFLDGFYNIGGFFNKRSPHFLFNISPDFSNASTNNGVKINMFKNLRSSKFAETFIQLHNFRKSTLDIMNQFEDIKSDYSFDIGFILNETLKLSKIEIDDRTLYDTLSLYGFTMTAFSNEFVFIIAERQNIITKLKKKVVRTTGIQIATSRALKLLDEFHEESKNDGKFDGTPIYKPSDEKEVIDLNKV